MKTAIATRLRCSCPLTDLEQFTPMLDTLIRQYLNKLVDTQGQRLCVPKVVSCRQGSRFQWQSYQTSYRVQRRVATENLCVDC